MQGNGLHLTQYRAKVLQRPLPAPQEGGQYGQGWPPRREIPDTRLESKRGAKAS